MITVNNVFYIDGSLYRELTIEEINSDRYYVEEELQDVRIIIAFGNKVYNFLSSDFDKYTMTNYKGLIVSGLHDLIGEINNIDFIIYIPVKLRVTL